MCKKQCGTFTLIKFVLAVCDFFRLSSPPSPSSYSYIMTESVLFCCRARTGRGTEITSNAGPANDVVRATTPRACASAVGQLCCVSLVPSHSGHGVCIPASARSAVRRGADGVHRRRRIAASFPAAAPCAVQSSPSIVIIGVLSRPHAHSSRLAH